jgi:hypothetical protein
VADTLQHIREQIPEKRHTIRLLREEDSKFLALSKDIAAMDQVQRLTGFLVAVQFCARAKSTAR